MYASNICVYYKYVYNKIICIHQIYVFYKYFETQDPRGIHLKKSKS